MNVGNAANATDELSASITEISRQIGQTSDVVLTAVNKAKAMSDRFSGLVRAAQMIGEVVKLIQQIAAQTNLLALNAGEHHMHGIVNHVRGIRGVEVAILLYETPSETRVTIRSRGNVSVAPVAASLGALGHKNAANFHLDKPLDDTKALVVDAFLSTLPRVEPQGSARRDEEKSEKRRAAARRHLRPAE